MTAPSPTALAAFRRILLTVPAGRPVSVNKVRDLITAADLPSASLGALFRAAQQAGWITYVASELSTEPAARGRRVGVYRREAMRVRSAA